MAVPRILLLVPLFAAGMYLPAAGTPKALPAGVLGMTHEGFSQTEVSVACGQTLTMQNDSNWSHIIGPGRDGTLFSEAGVPVTTRHLMGTNDTFTTGAWDTAGTFTLTCSVHPEMTVKVVVTGCCCAHA